MKKRAEKVDNVVALARKLMEKGAYVISNHAYERGEQRGISLGDIKNVIKTGYHEKRKDAYKEEFMDWNYAIKGMTLDSDLARVCIAFVQENSLIVVTVIRLEG
ncbi:MAG: DUF4258 domain-containing protein [Verrucomicrobia bacterium]|nr:DUF4258 domain-containing protein [Verrucomicrobiota bacterium]